MAIFIAWRKEIVGRIIPDKAIAYFGRTQGWSPAEVRQQVLTPIEESTIRGTAHADPNSIMCYQIPGSLTKDGNPIIGGRDIDAQDYSFAALIYPTTKKPKPSGGKPKRPVTRKRPAKPPRKSARKPK